MEDHIKFYPPTEVVENIRRQLLDHLHLDPLQVPSREWLALMAAATFRSMATCQDSTVFATRFLGLVAQKGDVTKNYTVRTPDGRQVQYNSEDVLLLRGVTVNGKPIVFTGLKISDKVKNSCDGCGGKTHCVVDIMDPDMREMIMSYCNHCTVHHTHPKVHDVGSHDLCKKCPSLSCAHHPDSATPALPQIAAYSH
jgi:hypothetical protein